MHNEQQKAIFQYWNGAADVYGDPLRIHNRMCRACEGDPNKLVDRIIGEDGEFKPENPLSFEAQEMFVRAVRFAFELLPFDPQTGQGAKESDCLRAWNSYTDWLQKKSPSTEQSQTSPPLSAATPT